MIQLAVCDENPNSIKQLKKWVSDEITKQKVSIETFYFRFGEELLWGLEYDGGYDLVFMNLASEQDLSVARQITADYPHCLIVFIVDDAAMVYDTFDIHPFAFIKKPVERRKFIKVCYDASKKVGKIDEIFRVDDKQKIHYQIPLHEILYFQSEKRVVHLICCNGESISFYNKLTDVENYIQSLSHNFVRIHQSFLVNKSHINKYRYNEVELNNGTVLPVSDRKKKYVRERIRYGNTAVT